MNRTRLIPFAALLVAQSAFAQWNPDNTVNNPVATAAQRASDASVSGVVSSPDGTGGAFVAWIDSRNSGSTGNDIYIMRIQADGTLAGGFTPGGTAVCSAEGSQSNLTMTPDGQNGVVLVWQDPRNTANNSNDIYAQRVNSDGDILWTNNGVAVSTQAYSETTPSVVPVSSLAVAVAWRGSVDGLDIFANYLALANGAKTLVADITVVTAANTQSNQQIAPDLVGGMLVTWTDGRTSNAQSGVRVQRWNAAGIKQWVDDAVLRPEGLSGSNALSPVIASDLLGGAVVAWGDTRNGATNQDIFIEHVNTLGIRDWGSGTNGILVTGATGNQSNPTLVNVLINSVPFYGIGWTDAQNGTSNVDVYGQLYNAAGAALWNGGSPLGICTLTQNQPATSSRSVALMPDELGNLTFVWDDRRNGGTSSNEDIYAQRIMPNGTAMWAPGGVPVAIRTESNQNNPVVAPGLSNSLIVAWPDNRSGTTAEIYASRLEIGGVLPLNQLSLDAVVKEKDVELLWRTTHEVGVKQHIVEKSVDAIKYTPIGSVAAQNNENNSYSLVDVSPAGNVSFYRIKALDNDGSYRYSNTVKVVFNNEVNTGMAVYPNPARGTVQLRLSNLPAGRYQVILSDGMGRVTTATTIEVNESLRVMNMPLPINAVGIYQLTLRNAEGKSVKSEKLLIQ